MAISTAVVLSSGGLNSCVLACMAKQEHRLALLHVEFAHRSARREKSCFSDQVDHFGPAQLLVVELPYLQHIRGNARVDRNLAIEDALALREGSCNSFVPGLIPTMLGVAQSWATAIGAPMIMIGVSENLGPPGPATNSLYPDYRREFYHLYNYLLQYAKRDRTDLRVETPLMSMSQAEIINIGQHLGAPFELTWSCLRGNDTPCGMCYGCATRAQSFAEAGIADPLMLQAGATVLTRRGEG